MTSGWAGPVGGATPAGCHQRPSAAAREVGARADRGVCQLRPAPDPVTLPPGNPSSPVPPTPAAPRSALPVEHWRKISSTTSLQRVDKFIRRRSRVVGILPKEASAIGFVGTVLADRHDDWISSDRHNLSEGSMVELLAEPDDLPTPTAELNIGD